MTTATVRPGVSMFKQVSRAPRRLLLFPGAIAAISLALLLVLGAIAAISGSARVPAARLDQVPATPMLSSPSSSASSAHTDPGCWVSGDLVGDANPATITAAFCGR
jgi:hypothetical protein